MKELVLYYSRSGNTKQVAVDFARANHLDICEIQTPRKINGAKAMASIVKATKGAGMPIVPPAIALDGCQAAHIFAPIWADCIAPPMNSAIALLPQGCALHLHLVSEKGTSGRERNTKQLEAKGYTVASYEDIKSEEKP